MVYSWYELTLVTFRGYLPYGRGSVVVRSTPVQCLENIHMTDPGVVSKITGRAFVAGGKPVKVRHNLLVKNQLHKLTGQK